MNDLILDPKTNIVLSAYDRLSHTFITGYPSSGIATYVSKLVAQDIKNGTPTILIDPYGDMSEKIKNDLSTKESENLVHIKVGSTSQPTLNILSGTNINKDTVVETVVELFYDLYDPTRTGVVGPRFEQAIRMATVAVLADDNPNFEKLVRIFTDNEYVQKLMSKVDDNSVKSYWQNLFKQSGGVGSSEIIDYVLSKLSLFVMHKNISNAINGDKPLNLVELIRAKKSVIFDLGSITYDTKAYTVLGAIILHIVETAIVATGKESGIALYIDEVHMLSVSKLSKIATITKRCGTALTYITSRASALLSGTNTLSLMYECGRFGTKLSFRQMNQDAANVAKLFVQSKDKEINLTTLKRFHAYVQTLQDSEIQPPVIIET